MAAGGGAGPDFYGLYFATHDANASMKNFYVSIYPEIRPNAEEYPKTSLQQV
jgi:hypothetical protein